MIGAMLSILGWIIAALLCIYMGGLIIQIIEQVLAMVHGEPVPQLVLSPSQNLNWLRDININTPDGRLLLVVLILVIIMASFIFYRLIKMLPERGSKDERGFRTSRRGIYGTARWGNKKDIPDSPLMTTPITQLHDIPFGRINGEMLTYRPNKDLDPKKWLNRHAVVIGSSGGMKSRSFIIPSVFAKLDSGDSLLITDTSGEIYSATVAYARHKGYQVRVFNVVEPQYSDGWNCLAVCQNTDGSPDLDSVAVFCDAIIANTNLGTRMGEAYFTNAVTNLLKALVLYSLMHETDPDKQTLKYVYYLVSSSELKDLDAMFESIRDNSDPAKQCYRLFNDSGQQRNNTKMDLGTRLSLLQSKNIANMLSTDSIRITELGEKPTILYAIVPELNSSYEWITSLFFSMVFLQNANQAKRNPDRKCKNPIYFLLDEFCSIGQIKDFERTMSNVRKYNMNIIMAFQSIAQLENRYPDNKWQEIISACDTELYLAVNDEETAKYLSDKLNDVTVVLNTIRKDRQIITNPFDLGMENVGYGKRKLLNTNEVTDFFSKPMNIIKLRGCPPFQTEKVDYTEYPQYKLSPPEHYTEYAANSETKLVTSDSAKTPPWQTYNPVTNKDIEASSASESPIPTNIQDGLLTGVEIDTEDSEYEADNLTLSAKNSEEPLSAQPRSMSNRPQI